MNFFKKAIFSNAYFVIPLALEIALVSFYISGNTKAYSHDFYQIYDYLSWVKHHADESIFPNVTRLYLAVCWVLLPIKIISLIKFFQKTSDNNKFVEKVLSNTSSFKITNSISLHYKYWVPAFLFL